MNLSQLLGMGNSMNTWGNPLGNLQPDINHLAKMQLLQNMLQIMNTNSFVNMGGGNNNNSSLLGNPSLNPFNVFLNEPNTLVQNKEPVALSREEEYGISGLYSHQQDQDISKGGISNTQIVDYSNITSSHGNQEETLMLYTLIWLVVNGYLHLGISQIFGLFSGLCSPMFLLFPILLRNLAK